MIFIKNILKRQEIEIIIREDSNYIPLYVSDN
jgi:hypothetical protein